MRQSGKKMVKSARAAASRATARHIWLDMSTKLKMVNTKAQKAKLIFE
jgi:hypothetical protein